MKNIHENVSEMYDCSGHLILLSLIPNTPPWDNLPTVYASKNK